MVTIDFTHFLWVVKETPKNINISLKAIRTNNVTLTLNVRGPSYLGLTRSISWLLMAWCPGSLRCQDISSHDIDYVEYVGPGQVLLEEWF